MRVAVITANLGAFDATVTHVPQEGVEVDVHVFTDADLPPRPLSLSPRLLAKIPKCFALDLRPGYDAYLWIDASLALSRSDSVRWFLDQMDGRTLAIFRHPHRNTVGEEADFLRTKLPHSRYLQKRYLGEDLDGLMAAMGPEAVTLPLYAAGCFCYKAQSDVPEALREWWGWVTRYHANDQLSLPYVLQRWMVAPAVIDEDIYHASHVAFVRERGHG